MVAGRPAPVTCTGGASGGDALLQPFVSVLPPVPEQCAAWPMYVSAPSVKMKFAVHWAPSVNVCTPGWIVAVAAGAQADAADGAMASAATAAAAARSRRCMGLASWFGVGGGNAARRQNLRPGLRVAEPAGRLEPAMKVANL